MSKSNASNVDAQAVLTAYGNRIMEVILADNNYLFWNHNNMNMICILSPSKTHAETTRLLSTEPPHVNVFVICQTPMVWQTKKLVSNLF